MSDIPEDFLDLIRCLREENCEFAIVGAYALAFHGHPRATQDIDIWVRPTAANSENVYRALAEYGAPVQAHGVSAKDFASPGNVYQIGLPPVRIDLLTSIAGITFNEATPAFQAGKLGEEDVNFIGILDQITNKRAAARLKDLADVEALERILASRES